MKKIECFFRERKFPGVQKVLRIMKLTIFLLLISVISVFASKTYSQTKLLVLDMKNSTVKEVLQNIEDQSEFVFMYSEKLVDVKRKVSINIEDKNVNEVLDELFAGTDVNYKVRDRFVLLTTPEVTGNDLMVQQQKSISGTVTDESELPLPGVTVVIKGTTIGTVTNMDGKYSISNLPDGATLQFSFVGMLTQEIVVINQSNIDVTMVLDAIGIEEVVAIGYGSMRKRDLTGAVASVSSEALMQDRAVTSIEGALKGLVSGVRVTQHEGGPNANNTVIIRGATSVSGENAPLYVVDGFPMDNFDLNAADIASVDILKDASSTAIYGSRGANGVIIVTTKTAKEQKPVIEFSAKSGVSFLAKELEMNSSEGYAKQMYYLSAKYISPTAVTAPGFTTYPETFDYYADEEGALWYFLKYTEAGDEYPYKNYKAYADSSSTNWQNVIYRPAVFQDYRISFAKRMQDNSHYTLSLNYVDQEGLIKNNDFQKITGRMNMTQFLGEKIKLVNHTYMTYNINDGYTNLAKQTLIMRPVQPPRGKFGDPNAPSGTVLSHLYTSPLDLVDIIDRNQKDIIFQSSLNFNYQINKAFMVDLGGSYRMHSLTTSDYTPSNTQLGERKKGIAFSRRWQNEQTNLNGLIQYTKMLNNEHKITAMLGSSYDRNVYVDQSSEVNNFSLELLGFWGMSKGSVPLIPILAYTETELMSFFNRITYDFKSKYILNFTMRADGSSKFAEKEKWGFFPSMSGAWRLSEEPFIKNISGFPTTKLRVGWGITGKQAIQPYQSLAILNTTQMTINGKDISPGAYTAGVENPYLRWETNEEYNIGLDVTFDNGRYGITADIYRKDTKDLLLNKGVPSYTGFTQKTENVGSLRNEGIELQLNGVLIDRDFKWNTNFNISPIRSKVLNIGEQGEMFLDNYGILREGNPIGQWIGYETEGIWQTYAEIQEAIGNGFTNQHGKAATSIFPGYTKFKDQLTVDTNGDGIPDAGDGIINADDRVILGKSAPDFIGGWYNNFSYRGFTLNIGLQYSMGGTLFNENKLLLASGASYNQLRETENRWFPKLYAYDPATYPNYSTLHDEGISSNKWRSNVAAFDAVESFVDDRYIEDGSFIRLSDITLSYTLPKRILGKTGIDDAKFYIAASNLAIFTNYTGYDPEVNRGNYKSLLLGYDNGAYPRERSVTLGVTLKL